MGRIRRIRRGSKSDINEAMLGVFMALSDTGLGIALRAFFWIPFSNLVPFL